MVLAIQGFVETKWVGNKARKIAPWGYKLWHSGKFRDRNEVGILIDREYIDDVVDVSRKSDRIMSIKLVIGDEVVTIVRVVMDLKALIHGGFGYDDRNEAGNAILDFALAYDLGIMNTWFEKRHSDLVTYRSGGNMSQIDFFIVRTVVRQCYTN
ncbi:uncharacterized protein [Spinacia oleracea]|uniref:Uncharacterized protein n=1 Tax=Spinacia oleracea TaxID=3562 RepID=A0ABM3R8M0_SPIOL|nr:uncharacterized protein LOC130467484 [Spinacia oleracea]